MKSLKNYIEECICITTPLTSIGMGNPQGPDQNGIASEHIITGKAHKLKRKKKKNKKTIEVNK